MLEKEIFMSAAVLLMPLETQTTPAKELHFNVKYDPTRRPARNSHFSRTARPTTGYSRLTAPGRS